MAKYLIFYLILQFCLFNTPTEAQNSAIQAIWNQAKKEAQTKNWSEVRSIIRPHILPPPEDSLAPFLLQLYALACDFESDNPSAIVTLQKLEEKYPDWSGISETRFLLGGIYLQQRKFTKGCTIWNLLSDQYLADAEHLVKRKRIVLPKDTMDILATKRGFDKIPWSVFNPDQKKPKPGQKKGSVPQVGIVFPFNLQQQKPANQEHPAFDFYRGLLLASEVLAANDSAVGIHTFDSKNEVDSLSKLLKNNSLRGLNLVIGPIRNNLAGDLAQWSDKNSIPMINPLSNTITEKRGKEFFLQEPSFETIANQCFNFVSQYSTGNKVGIIFGVEKNDSILAYTYKELMKKMGREVVLIKKVGKNSAANLTKFLTESGLDSTSHLFVPNNETLVRVQLLSAYSWIKGKFPIMVYGKWLNSANIDFDEVARHPIYFINPDFPDHGNPHWNEWSSSYISKWGTPPSWIAWKGFDLLMTFARSWYHYGPDWTIEWKSGRPVESSIFGAYQYSPLYSDNRYIPVYKVDTGGFIKVWPQ